MKLVDLTGTLDAALTTAIDALQAAINAAGGHVGALTAQMDN